MLPDDQLTAMGYSPAWKMQAFTSSPVVNKPVKLPESGLLQMPEMLWWYTSLIPKYIYSIMSNIVDMAFSSYVSIMLVHLVHLTSYKWTIQHQHLKFQDKSMECSYILPITCCTYGSLHNAGTWPINQHLIGMDVSLKRCKVLIAT